MALWLEQRSADFETRFGALLAAKRESSPDVNESVAAIINRVRRDKDAGLIDLTLHFDRVDLRKIGMRVSQAEIAEAPAPVHAQPLPPLQPPPHPPPHP